MVVNAFKKNREDWQHSGAYFDHQHVPRFHKMENMNVYTIDKCKSNKKMVLGTNDCMYPKEMARRAVVVVKPVHPVAGVGRCTQRGSSDAKGCAPGRPANSLRSDSAGRTTLLTPPSVTKTPLRTQRPTPAAGSASYHAKKVADQLPLVDKSLIRTIIFG